MKNIEVEAETHLQIYVRCPHCEDYQDRLEDLREYLDPNEIRAESCEAELMCFECKKFFVVTKITY